MSQFPLEIWEWIIILACTNDGTAGSSLSAVCHSFRRATAPHRYFCIGLKSLSSALKFAELLRRTSREDITVRHLFITNDPRHRRPVEDLQPVECAATAMTRGRRVLHRLLPHSVTRFFHKRFCGRRPRKWSLSNTTVQTDATSPLMIEAIRFILYRLSPTLETLSLSIDFDQLEHIPSLPHLTDLTLTLRTAWPRVMGSVFRRLPPLPSLRRLDLLGVECLDPPDRILLDSVTYLPQLTHICLPVIRSNNFQAVALALGPTMTRIEAKKRETSATACPPLWVLVQADPWDTKGGSTWHEKNDLWMPRGTWSEGIRSFRECAKDHDWLRLHQRRVPVDICTSEQESHWTDRLTDGEGCWGLDGNPRNFGAL